MGHISANDHTIAIQYGRLLQLVIGTIQLSIDLQEYVRQGTAIFILFEYGCSPDTLCQNATAKFSRLFDLSIGIAAIWNYAEQNVGIFVLDAIHCSINVRIGWCAAKFRTQLFDEIVIVERHLETFSAPNQLTIGKRI